MQKIVQYTKLSFGILALVLFFTNLTLITNAQMEIPSGTGISETPLYRSNAGNVTSINNLNDTEFLETQVSFWENGTMSGIGNVTNTGIFLETYKSDNVIFGQGKGSMTTDNGEFINWTSYDLGEIGSDKAVKYRGIIFFSALSEGKLDFLNNTIGLYTSDVGNNDSSLRQIWQWK